MEKDLNKILLEAIHRGINLALDDFDDELVGLQTLTIKDINHTKGYLDLMDLVVDLGLPSGTLWCKYNLDVNPYLLSKAEDWYGGYYAWGEIETKSDYTWGEWKDTYSQVNIYKYAYDYDDLIKYCNKSDYGHKGYTDNLTLLLSEDDVAYLNIHLYDFKFHIPTKELWDELLKYTISESVTNYKKIIGLNGRIFKARNGNILFIPMGGYYDGTELCRVASYCYSWSSNLNIDKPYFAWNIYFDDLVPCNCNMDFSSRYLGFPIRPVVNL